MKPKPLMSTPVTLFGIVCVGGQASGAVPRSLLGIGRFGLCPGEWPHGGENEGGISASISERGRQMPTVVVRRMLGILAPSLRLCQDSSDFRCGSPGFHQGDKKFGGESVANRWRIGGESVANRWRIGGKSVANR